MKSHILLVACLMLNSWSYAQDQMYPHKRSDRKILEISKIIMLTEQQETLIRQAYDEYNQLVDSSLYKINNPIAAAEVKYQANKNYNEQFMNILTDEQKRKYIQTTSAPEIKAKAAYKVSLLAESEDYSQTELDNKETEIYNYLMAEKLVYVRDKFDHKKQKENIRKLKNIEPSSIKESNMREKFKAQGRMKKGKVNW